MTKINETWYQSLKYMSKDDLIAELVIAQDHYESLIKRYKSLCKRYENICKEAKEKYIEFDCLKGEN